MTLIARVRTGKQQQRQQEADRARQGHWLRAGRNPHSVKKKKDERKKEQDERKKEQE